MNKQTFEFFLDQKRTIWYRNTIKIDAENKQDAIIKLKELYKSDDLDNNWEQLLDTSESISVSENDGTPTEEMLTSDFELLFDNTIKDQL